MKKMMIPLLLAGTMCFSLAACGPKDDNGGENGGTTVTITENTDPVTLTGEKVDRTAWTSAFGTETNYTVKTELAMNLTEGEETTKSTMTLVYRFTQDKYFFTINMKTGKATTFEAEAYVELDGDTVSMWQRTKESGSKEWSDWDGEEYQKEDLGDMLSAIGDLSFAKENYANFSYSDTDKGYAATASGLTAMEEKLESFVEGILSQLPADAADVDITKLVLKIVGGKPGALLMDLKVEMEEADELTRDNDMLPEEDEDETPDDGDDDTTPGEDETKPAPTATINLTQIFYNYGKTEISRPENLPSLSEEEGEEEGGEENTETPDLAE